ncbi:DUF4406 domain-containing protein, partial [Pseudomonas aeruginosa]
MTGIPDFNYPAFNAEAPDQSPRLYRRES